MVLSIRILWEFNKEASKVERNRDQGISEVWPPEGMGEEEGTGAQRQKQLCGKKMPKRSDLLEQCSQSWQAPPVFASASGWSHQEAQHHGPSQRTSQD